MESPKLKVCGGYHRALQDRVDAVEEILSSSSDLLVTLRHILKNLPDLAKGLCRIQYGKVRVLVNVLSKP